MEKTQREFLLRQQLAAIRKELGEDEPDGADDYRTRVEAADLPEHVRKAALTEVGKLERASDQSPESGWIRTWLDTVLDIPWNTRTDDNDDLVAARAILDADHAGLDDVKERLIEFLAVRARRDRKGMEQVGGRGSGAVLALVGPPGVGKTSLGESVARALGRKFVRVALGGVRDEAEIRGHRRTYVGALPGRIVRAIREAGSMNPVVLLDEIDKVGSDFRGDPTAALLEVLDPAQNHTFRDHYLEVDLDLSDVLFLATANVVEAIPGPLVDRMEVVTLDGYTEAEKVAIARDHLLPRQIDKAGLEPRRRRVHRRGAGHDRRRVHPGGRRAAAGARAGQGAAQGRGQARRLGRRDAAGAHRRRPAGHLPGPAAVHPGVGRAHLGARRGHRARGHRRRRRRAVHRGHRHGRRARPDPDRAARRRDEGVGVDRAVLPALARAGRRRWRRSKLHVHVPAGAVPKDGPSAGITMTTALASLASGRPVRSSVGMTGEVTLQGKVLPIGGVKQKLLAAHRAGLTEVIIPKRNEPDLDDLPESVRGQLRVHPVSDVSEVLALALEPAPATAAA